LLGSAWLWFGFDGFKNLRALLSDEHVRIARHEAKTDKFFRLPVDCAIVGFLDMTLDSEIALAVLAGVGRD
jgi:hypothetical protein